MSQYFLISLKSAEFGIFSQLKVQSNPVNSGNLEKHDISGQKWPEYLVKIMKSVKNDKNSHFWTLNHAGVGRRRKTQILRHMRKARKIPLLRRFGWGFWGFLSFQVKNTVFGSKNSIFW